MISERPAEAARSRSHGHWEGDLILGTGQLGDRHAGGAHQPLHDAAAPAAVERPRRPAGARTGRRSPAHGAEAVRDAIAAAIGELPEQLRRSLTWDQGAEMAEHARLRIDSGLQVYFCDPQSPVEERDEVRVGGPVTAVGDDVDERHERDHRQRAREPRALRSPMPITTTSTASSIPNAKPSARASAE